MAAKKPAKTKDELSTQQQLFVSAILRGINVSDALKEAGYKATTPNAVSACSSRLLSNAKIKSAISAGRAELSVRAMRTVDDVFKDIVDVTKAATTDKDHRGALQGLKLQGDYLGMFVKQVAVTGQLTATLDVGPAVQDFIKGLNNG